MSSSTSTVSISDLVPLVASVLQDKAVTDKIEELQQQLNNANDERLLVQITGRNGTPVYYQASLKDGVTRTYSGDRVGLTPEWLVGFGKKKVDNNGDTIVLPTTLIHELEIRLGGYLCCFMRNTIVATDWGDDSKEFGEDRINNTDEPKIGGIHFIILSDTSPEIRVGHVHGKIGPVSWSNYIQQLDGMYIPELITFANDNRDQAQNLIITAVELSKDLFSESIIALLEKMGTSTTNLCDANWAESVRNTGCPPPTSSI